MPDALRMLPAVLILTLAVQQAARPQTPADHDITAPGRHELSLEAAGRTWHYLALVPSAARSERPLPVVLILHGAGGSGQAYLDHAGWAAKAEKEGFLAIAPDGQPARSDQPPSFLLNPRLWNTGQLRPFNLGRRSTISPSSAPCSTMSRGAGRSIAGGCTSPATPTVQA